MSTRRGDHLLSVAVEQSMSLRRGAHTALAVGTALHDAIATALEPAPALGPTLRGHTQKREDARRRRQKGFPHALAQSQALEHLCLFFRVKKVRGLFLASRMAREATLARKIKKKSECTGQRLSEWTRLRENLSPSPYE